MSNQYQNTTAYQNHTDASLLLGIGTGNRYNQTVGGTRDKQGTNPLSLGAVGDLLTGTVVTGGTEPVVEMNGTPIQVRTDVLQNARPGDQIYLEITGSNPTEVTMKLVDQDSIPITGRSGITQTEIRKNTAQFVENWKQATKKQDTEYGDLQEEAKLVLETISEEERNKLRQMGIELTSANLTFVKSLLSQFRGEEQKEELKQAIDSVRKQIALTNPQEHKEEFRLTIQGESLNLSEITEEVDRCLPISEEQTTYLIQNELPLSLENLYKSEYSSKPMPANTTLTETAFQQLLPQIRRTIQAAGMEVSSSSLDAARFLLQHNLPVNTDSLATYTAIQDINENGLQASEIGEQLADQTAQALARIPSVNAPFQPEETQTEKGTEAVSNVLNQYRSMELYFPSAKKVAEQIAQDLQQITEEGVRAFADTGLPFTLNNLSAFCQKDTFAKSNDAANNTPASLQALTAHRQLEELRLKMTWEAGYALASEDIHIRARELSQVVEALRNLERDSYKQLFRSEGTEPTAETVRQIQETNTAMQELPYLPASALGATLFSGAFTIERLHENGITALQKSNTPVSHEAAASYEALMTRPRSDMGDTIQKAFQNVTQLLDELNLPDTQENQRAVRILGYNQMELTPEHIEQVKDADSQVQTLIQNLQPPVVLHLVRSGINPLSMPIEELNDLIQDYIQEEDLAGEERFSEFLQQLDRKGTITKQERNRYIGIYRLLDKVTRSKGKDIGTLVRNGQSVTLQNLLTAHRSNRAVGMDTVLDESFGGYKTSASENSISDQILDGFDPLAPHQQYMANQLLHRLTPELIQQMTEESANGTTLEAFFDQIQYQLTEEAKSPEKADDTNPSEPAAEAEIQSELLQGLDAFDDNALNLMNTMQVFPSISNMAAMSDITKRKNYTFRTIDTLSKAGDTGEAFEEQLEGLSEHLNSPAEMEEAYANLETAIAEQIHKNELTGTITAKDIQALKQVRAGLRIMQKMSRQEQFQIPFSVNGQWNIIHLSILQGTDAKGLLQADIPTQNYGTLSADLSWKNDHWEGTLQSDRPEGTAFLERYSEQLTGLIEESSSFETSTSADAPSTNDIYRMAKQLIRFIKHMEL